VQIAKYTRVSDILLEYDDIGNVAVFFQDGRDARILGDFHLINAPVVGHAFLFQELHKYAPPLSDAFTCPPVSCALPRL
jgi:hypothetical protein